MSNEKNKVLETPEVQQSNAEKIWSEIKDKEIFMFALPGKKVSDFCQPVMIDPSRCFLMFRASSVLPSLEEVIGKEYECEAVDKYIVITRKQKNVF